MAVLWKDADHTEFVLPDSLPSGTVIEIPGVGRVGVDVEFIFPADHKLASVEQVARKLNNLYGEGSAWEELNTDARASFAGHAEEILELLL